MLDSPQTQGTDKGDVWSTGILLYAILTKAMLFDGDPCEALSEIRSISQDDIYLKLKTIRDPNPRGLLMTMLVKDAEKRSSFSQLLHHPYIKKGLSLLEAESHPTLDYYKRLSSTTISWFDMSTCVGSQRSSPVSSVSQEQPLLPVSNVSSIQPLLSKFKAFIQGVLRYSKKPKYRLLALLVVLYFFQKVIKKCEAFFRSQGVSTKVPYSNQAMGS